MFSVGLKGWTASGKTTTSNFGSELPLTQGVEFYDE